jgi:hypothetical protein
VAENLPGADKALSSIPSTKNKITILDTSSNKYLVVSTKRSHPANAGDSIMSRNQCGLCIQETLLNKEIR